MVCSSPCRALGLFLHDREAAGAEEEGGVAWLGLHCCQISVSSCVFILWFPLLLFLFVLVFVIVAFSFSFAVCFVLVFIFFVYFLSFLLFALFLLSFRLLLSPLLPISFIFFLLCLFLVSSFLVNLPFIYTFPTSDSFYSHVLSCHSSFPTHAILGNLIRRFVCTFSFVSVFATTITLSYSSSPCLPSLPHSFLVLPSITFVLSFFALCPLHVFLPLADSAQRSSLYFPTSFRGLCVSFRVL